MSQASSKDVVQKLFREAFPRFALGSAPLIDNVSSHLSVTAEEASQVIHAVHSLSRHVVHRGLTSAEQILSVFPDDFHQNLKNLLTKILLDNVSAWRSEAQNTSISLPRLVDMDWLVDIKTSSDSVTKMAVPTCLLNMKV
ncbi:hypothetical protein GDO81_029827, partial [Engystomops pustulosus]